MSSRLRSARDLLAEFRREHRRELREFMAFERRESDRMKRDRRIVDELVKFVKEQRQINQHLEDFVREQYRLNEHSERRFKVFYHEISKLKHAG